MVSKSCVDGRPHTQGIMGTHTRHYGNTHTPHTRHYGNTHTHHTQGIMATHTHTTHKALWQHTHTPHTRHYDNIHTPHRQGIMATHTHLVQRDKWPNCPASSTQFPAGQISREPKLGEAGVPSMGIIARASIR